MLSATWALPMALVPATWDFETHGYPKAPTPSTKRSLSGMFRKKSAVGKASGSGSAAEGKKSPAEGKGKEKEKKVDDIVGQSSIGV